MEFSEIGIIAACSHTKTRRIHRRLRARSLKARTTAHRAKEWIERIESTAGEMQAFSLYCGVYWSGVANLWRKAASRQVDAPLWILSAGYGLIPTEAEIAPYAATLSPNDHDSVVVESGVSELGCWWNKLADWPGPSAGSPRTLQALAAEYPRTLWIVIGGTQYVYALTEQLQAVQERDGHAGRFILVSPGLSGRKNTSAIDRALLRADSRWEEKLGRGKVSIGIKIATYLFDRAHGHPGAIADVRSRMQHEVESLKGLKTPQRAIRSDLDVRRHLKTALKKQPDLSFTRALRDFRDSGLACEYKRFRGLYQEVKESRHAKAK